MLDHLRGLAVFAKVAETGSFRAAARLLDLSPSVASHHVASLEERLGATLINRSTRKLVLTAAGEQLLSSASVMLNAAEEGIARLGCTGGDPIGVLRLAVPMILAGNGCLMPILAEFSACFPRVQLVVSASDMRADVIEGGYDMAIRMGLLSDSALLSRKLYQMPRVLVASSAYALRHPSPSLPEDLAEWDWIHFLPRPRLVELFDRNGQVARVWGKDRFTVDSAMAAHRLALAGTGLATLPRALVEADLAQGMLVEILPDWRVPAIDVFAVWPASAPRDALVNRLINFLVDALKTH